MPEYFNFILFSLAYFLLFAFIYLLETNSNKRSLTKIVFKVNISKYPLRYKQIDLKLLKIKVPSFKDQSDRLFKYN